MNMLQAERCKLLETQMKLEKQLKLGDAPLIADAKFSRRPIRKGLDSIAPFGAYIQKETAQWGKVQRISREIIKEG